MIKITLLIKAPNKYKSIELYNIFKTSIIIIKQTSLLYYEH